MALIIIDYEGTIADDRARLHHLQVNMHKYYSGISFDPINPVCQELLEDIVEKEKDKEPIFVFVTCYPKTFDIDETQQMNVGGYIKSWLLTKKLGVTSIMTKPKKSDHVNYTEDKVRRISKIVLEHIEERNIYYLENDLSVALKAKEKFPTVYVYHVSYDDYNLLK